MKPAKEVAYKSLSESGSLKPYIDKCPHCDIAPIACPFCGSPAIITGQNEIACDNFNCSVSMNWGHWCGEQNSVPAVHWVIEAWNNQQARREGVEEMRERAAQEVLIQQLHSGSAPHPTAKAIRALPLEEK